jgi:tetratricopeptide (TPR) repeat protein
VTRTRQAAADTAPEPLDHRLHRARALHRQGETRQAQALYEEILKTQPKQVEALNGLGTIAAQTRDMKKALILFSKAAAADPHHAGSCVNRALALQELDALDAALESLDQAIALQPDYAEAYFSRGNVLKELNRLEEALASYDAAIAINEGYAEAYTNRGVVLNNLKRLDAALADFNRAIGLHPHSAKAHCNRSFTALLRGDFANGWIDYEWRWKLETAAVGPASAEFARRLWLGSEDLAGKTILIYSEQGFGDTIQFCRYVGMVARLGVTVVLAVQKPLMTLLAGLPGVSRLIDRDARLPEFDYQCPLLSLPLAFGTDIDTIPRSSRYLCADPAKVARWRSRLGERGARRIGLVWSRGEARKNDRNRSTSLTDLLALLPAEFQYVSLQKALCEQDKKALRSNPRVLSFAQELKDFSDTAALCECMDLVISIDTSVAHLSAALGMHTWILLPFDPGWRWLLNRNDSPWYPTVALFRQDRPGDWTSAFEQIEAALAQAFASAS